MRNKLKNVAKKFMVCTFLCLAVILQSTIGNISTVYAAFDFGTVLVYDIFFYDTSTGYITNINKSEGRTDVIIPDEINGVEIVGIDSLAFSLYSELETVEIPDSIVYIADDAFTNSNPIIKCNTASYAAKWSDEHGFSTDLLDINEYYISLSESETIYVGETIILKATIMHNDEMYLDAEGVEWYCSDERIVATTVLSDYYEITLQTTGISKGTAVITAQFKGLSAQCEIKVLKNIEELASELNSDIKLNNHGTAFAYFALKDSNGEPLSNTKVSYKVDENGRELTTTTNEYGLAKIQAYNLTGSGETKTLTCKFYGADLQQSEFTFDVYISPLSFTHTWTGKLSGNVGVKAKFGVDGKIGVVEGEASLASIGATGSQATTLSVSDSYNNGIRTLSLAESMDNSIAAKAQTGLFTESNIVANNVELSALNISGNASVGQNNTVTLKIENYDPSDTSHLSKIGYFLLAASADNSNAYVHRLLALWNMSAGNEASSATNVKLSAGAEVGTAKADGIGSFTLAGLSADGVWSGSQGYDKDGNIIYSTGITTDARTKIGTVSSTENISDDAKVGISAAAFATNLINNKTTIQATTDSSGNVKKLKFSALANNDNSTVFWNVTNRNTYKNVMFSDENAQNVVKSNDVLKELSNGDRTLFGAKEISTAISDMVYSEENGTYTYEQQNEEGIDASLSFGLTVGIGFDIGIGLSGIKKDTYETANGKLVDGYFYDLSSATIDSHVENDGEDLGDLLQEPIETLKETVENFLSSVYDNIKNGISNGMATITEKFRTSSNRYVSITTIDPQLSAASLQSFEILAVPDEVSLFATSSVATTIGEPYVIAITDEDGNEIDDFSDEPIQLTISYTEDMLTAAGVDDVSQIGIYYWDSEKSAYMCMGGTLDSENMSVTLDITKPGQYILAADNCPPSITDMEYTNNSGNHTISAIVADMSGIAEFELSIDDDVVVDSDSFADYYNAPTAEFEYTFPTELLNGEHTAKITAADSSGNTMESPECLVFTVDNNAPEIANIEIPSYVIDGALSVGAEVSDDNLLGVYAYIEYNDDVYTYPMVSEGNMWYIDINDLPEFAEFDIWICAYDGFGNSAESRHFTTLIAKNLDEKAVCIGVSEADNLIHVFVNSLSPIDGAILIGVYNENDECTDIMVEEYSTVNEIDEVDFSIDVSYSKIKAFLWDNVESMQPLCESYTVQFN